MQFNEILRRLREKAGLTQAGLAERAGVPLRTIQGWEQAYRCPVSPDFFSLVRALGVSADAFADLADVQAGKKANRRPRRGR
jgi:transcriptional regulator with XRE-family HTH domain